VKYDKNAWFPKVTKNFSKNSIKNFPLITQFFDFPFGVFRREIAGNGHSRLLKFKIFRGSLPPDPPKMLAS
jgi:hypothetical protein